MVVGDTAHPIQCTKKVFALQIMVMEMVSMLLSEIAKGTFHVVEAGQLFSLVKKLFILITFYSPAHLRKMLGVLEFSMKSDESDNKSKLEKFENI